MATGGNNRINFQVGFNVDRTSLNQVKTAFQEIQNIKPASFSGTEAELQDIKLKARQVESALTKAFNVKLGSINVNQFYSSLDKAKIKVDDLYTDLSKIGNQGRSAFNALATSLTTTNTQLVQTTSLFDKIGTTLMNTVKWTVASSAIKAFTSSISQAFTYVKSLDSSLNDIRIVTKDSADQMANFAAQANRAASQLGRSTLDYTKAALTFYQQGLDDQAVQARTQAVLKAQNITGAGSEMADYLTAVWNGYKVVNEEAELYVDKLAAVADSSASNMSQIAVAMSRVSSAANSLGVDVDSLTAQIATIVATTRQAPESVGNALKTIYARINDISVGADDAEVTLGHYSTQMRSVGINVLDASGRLRDTGDVLDEVGEKWSTLSREQQIFLARTMAGQRQYNKLISLFDNWSKYTDLVTVSMQAQGATEQKNAIYMESLAAHTEQLGAAQQRLKSSMVDSDSYKSMIDVATSGITLFANFIQSIGGGGNALLMLGSIATQVFSGTIAKEISNSIIQARTNKQIFEETQQVMQRVAQERKSAAYNDSENVAYKNYIDNLSTLHNSWSVLSQDERQAQERRAVQIRQLAQQKKQLQDGITVANNFAKALTGRDVEFEQQIAGKVRAGIEKIKKDLEDGQKAINNFYNAIGNDNVITSPGLDQLRQNIENLKIVGGENLAQSILQGLKKMQQGAFQTDEQFQALQQQIDNFYYTANRNTNFADNFYQNKQKIQQVKQSLEDTSATFQRVNENSLIRFNTESIIKGVAGLGQMASALNSVINLTKIWNDESLSTGQKILQTFMNLSMTLTMLTSGFSKFRQGLKAFTGNFFELADTQRLAQQELITAQKTKQALLEQKINNEKRVNLLLAKSYYDQQTGEMIYANGLEEAQNQLLKTQLAYEKAITNEEKAQSTFDSTQNLPNDSMLGKLTTKIKGIGHSIAQAFSNHPVIAWGTVALVTIGGIIAIIKSMPSELEKAKEQADRLNQVAKDNYTNFSSLGSAIQTISSDFKQLADAENTLNGLTIGTEQWATQLNSVNQQVTQLIQKYPQLKEFLQIDANGQLGFREGAMQAVQSGLKQQREAAAAGYVSAERSASEAQNRVSIAQTAEQIGRSSAQVTQALNILNSQGLSAFDDLRSIFEAFGIDVETASNSERDLVYAIYSNQAEIVKLNNTINTNNQKTDNLIATMIKTSTDFTQFKGFNEIASEIGQETYKNTFANRVANLGQSDLDSKYFDTHVNNIMGIQERQLNMDRVVQAYEKQLESALGTAVDIIEGQDGKFTYQYAGKVVDLTTEGIISGLAYFENKNQLSEEVATQIQRLLDTGLESALTLDKDKDGNVKVDVSQLSLKDVEQLQHRAGGLAVALGVSTEEVEKALNEAAERIEIDFDNFVKGLDPAIQQAFSKNGIEASKYSKQVAQSFANLLQNALNNNDVEGFNLLSTIGNGLNESQLSAFVDLANSIDYSTITANEFESKLRAAGIATNVTTEALQAYINKQREAAEETDPYAKNKSIADITGNLQQGGTLDPVQYAKLTALDEGFSQFFKRTIDGTWELIATTNQFKKAVQSIKLDNLDKQIKENNDKIKQLGNVKIGATGFGDQLNALKAFGVNTASWEVQLESDNSQGAIKAIDEAYQNLALTEEKVAAQQEVLKEENKELTEVIDRAREKVQGLNHALDADVKEDKFKALSDYFNTRDVKGYADIFQEDREAAEELAEELLRFDSALERVKSNYQDWKIALDSGNDSQIGLILPDLANAYSDLLDIDPSVLGDGFLRSTDNLKLFNDVLNGTETQALNAYNQLQELSLMQIIPQVSLQDQQFKSELDWLIEESNRIENDTSIDIGATLDPGPFTEGVTKLIQQSAKTKEQAEAILKSFGVEATLVQKPPVTQTTTVKVPHYSIEYQKGPASGFISPDQAQSGRVGTWTPVDLHEETYTTTSTIPGGWTIEAGSMKKSTSPYSKVTSSPTRANTQANKKSGGGGSKKSPKKSNKKGSSKKKKEEKTVDKDLGFENKQLTYDPYEQVTKQLERQSDQLEKLQKQEDKLTGKDRLANLQKQNDTLQKQNQLLRQRQKISDNANKKNTTSWFKKQLKTTTSFKDIIKFDSDGQISDIAALQRKAEQTYNNTVKNADKNYEAVEKKYNNYIKKYNKMSAKKQESSKVQKELQKWKEALKDAEETAKNAQKSAEEKYKLDVDLIKSYTEALEKDNETRQNWLDNLDKITEIKFAKVKVGVDLSLEMGQLERDWLDFEDKFIKRLGKDDFLGQAQSADKKLFSFFDTNQLEDQVKTVKNLRLNLITLSRQLDNGQNSNKIRHLLGISTADWAEMTAEQKQAARQAALAMKKEDLQNYLKTLQNSLTTMQEQADIIRDSVLSGLDKAKSDMDDQISQFERVNSLIEHGAKLSEMLFGEKAYDNAVKFYNMQKQNNIKEIQRIAQNRAYWENIYQQQRLANDNERDEQLMQKALSNLQAFDDQLRSTLEETIDILHNEWESKVQSTLQKMNNTLTSGYGLDFANEEWDYVTKFDDYFLDNVESKMGIEEIERLFDNASKAAAGDANAQARLSKIYQEQMKTLRNKEKLTQYDIDRAKKMLEIEQARLAIEKAREQKTTMRLRRDSQGNYTYRYVADEDEVADLADKLANLEYNLYEDDKNQYKKNLNQMLSFYEDYQKKMMELEWELQQAKNKGDEEQIERMQKRIDALKEYGQAMGDNLALNQDWITSTYWTQSTADSLDIENYTRQQMLETMTKNIPIVGVALQQLDKNIRSAGGFLEALAPFEEEITTASQEYAAALTSAMDAAQTSTATMTADIDKAVDQTTKIVDNYDTIINKTKEEVDEVGRLLQNVNEAMEKLRSGTELMRELYNSYYSIQNLNQLNAADDKNGRDLVSRVGLTSTTLDEKMESLWAEWKDFYQALLGADEMATGGYTGAWGDDGRVAVLHEKELVLNAADTSNLLAAVGAVRDITNRMSITSALDSLAASQTGLLNTLYNQHSQLDQNVHIEANFPNVTQHTEIEQAFENLVNIASMHASKRVD